MNTSSICWNLGNRKITSRLIVPTARERIGEATKSHALEAAARLIVASGTQFYILGTSSSCRIGTDLCEPGATCGLSLFDTKERVDQLLAQKGEQRQFYTLINTSRSTSAKEAIDRATAGYELLKDSEYSTTLIKLEVFYSSLYPKSLDVVIAAQELKQRFPELDIIPLIGKMPALVQLLIERVQCPAFRIFGSAIGSNQGLGNERLLKSAISAAQGIPVIAEGGIATPEHIRRGIELGVTAFLVNSAIAESTDPISLVIALRKAAEGH